MVQVLKQCGDDLTRENVIRQAANLNNFELGLLLPGIKVNTSPTDFFPVEQTQMSRFNRTRRAVRSRDRQGDRDPIDIASLFHFPPSFAAGASLAGGASGFFFWSSAAFFCAACKSSTIFCSEATPLFRPSICRLAASSFC